MANLRTNNLSGEQGQNAYRGSVFFHGGGQLDVTSNSDFAVGTGAYTAEVWFHSGLNSGENSIFGTFTASNFGFGMWHNANNLYFEERQNAFSGDNPRITYDKFEEGYWYHLAMCRDSSSGTLRAYVNGVQIGSTTSNLRTIAGTAPTIGENGAASNQCKGYISNIRFSNTELYPSGTTFTPPTSELTADASTILLACQNSDDPTQEETGKTLTNSSLLSGQPKVIPPVGRDAGNAFGGPIQQSSQGYMYFPTGRTEERVIVNNNFGARGLIMGGITYPGTTYVNVIESIQIASLGNSVDFGDLTNKPNGGAGFSSKTRGFVAGGNTPDGYGINVIQFVTIATAGNATDFGDAGYSRANARGVSNNTRGVYSGGESASSPNPSLNNIEFITMSTSGNGQDFGDLVDAGSSYATASSPTRGLNLGGYRDGEVNFIDFITIATTGNSQEFGDLINTSRNGNGGVSNGHRGIVMGGYASPARTNTIQYVTIQSMGNAIDFGDLTDARDPAVTSSLTRGIACTGDYPANTNIIDFIEIMTTANAVDFGDMLTKTSSAQTCSNAHGGLADDM